MRLSNAEKEHIQRERTRIALDARDWNKEPYVTQVQLREMSPHMRYLFVSKTWRYDEPADVWRNTVHPDNADWTKRELLWEEVARQNSVR